MKAVTWHGARDVRVDEVPDPTIEQPTDALVRITSTAICGSDLHLSCGHCYMCDQQLFTQCATTQVRAQGMGAVLAQNTTIKVRPTIASSTCPTSCRPLGRRSSPPACPTRQRRDPRPRADRRDGRAHRAAQGLPGHRRRPRSRPAWRPTARRSGRSRAPARPDPPRRDLGERHADRRRRPPQRAVLGDRHRPPRRHDLAERRVRRAGRPAADADDPLGVEALGSHRVPLAEAPEACKISQEKKAFKVVPSPNGAN